MGPLILTHLFLCVWVFFFPACVYVHHVYAEEGVRSPDSFETPCGYWVLKPGPLEDVSSVGSAQWVLTNGFPEVS